MSEPAEFAVIRDGRPRVYGDRWAAVFLFRELLWGPEELEQWVSQLEELDEWDGDCSGGAVLDFDRRRLVWSGDFEPLKVPPVYAAYERLLQTAWPQWEIVFAGDDLGPLSEAVGMEVDDDFEPHRPDTVLEAAGIDDEDDEDEDDEDEDEEEYDEDEDEDEDEGLQFDEEDVRAWVTVIDADGAVRHRHLNQLPRNLLDGARDAVEQLASLPPAEVPPEAVVSEGMWIDVRRKTVGLWGSPAARAELPRVRNGWKGWTVEAPENGYAAQCAACNLTGVPMSEPEALAKVLPIILSTQRFDMQSVLGAMGASLKNTAIKATGCLLLVICLPLVVFGAVSGNWREVGIAIAVTSIVVIVLFKIIEFRVRRSFSRTLPPRQELRGPPVAGPLDKAERRDRLDGLLASAGLPPLAKVEPLFPKESELDLLE
jgi:hypothetical protein